MDSNDLIIEAGDIADSVLGLGIFVSDHFTCSDNITKDDISSLNGLVASIRLLGHTHAEHIHYLDDFEIEAKNDESI